MKKYDVYGLGNALVDILVRVNDSEFASLGLEKATMRLVDAAEQKDVLDQFKNHHPKMASAGSVANSIYAIGQLGGKGVFSGSVGDDSYGLFYKNEFESLGIEFPSSPAVGGTTGTCLIFVTPDAERTMRTCLAVSSDFGAEHIEEEIVKKSKWIFLEGYLLSNPSNIQGALHRMIELAKKHDTKIAFTCSESWVISSFRELVDTVIESADLVFANEGEAYALSGGSNAKEAFEILKNRYPNVAITAGADGAYLSVGGQEEFIPSYPCTPVDLTGAGDAFAGTLLYGISNGVSLKKSGQAACYIASKIISHVGARYPGDIKDFWKEVVE